MHLAHTACQAEDIHVEPPLAGACRHHVPTATKAVPAAARRARFGRTSVDIRVFRAQHAIQLAENANMVHLVVPLAGAITAIGQSGSHEVTTGTALLIARNEPASCVGFAGTNGLLLHIPRAAMQVAGAAITGEPCRLAPVNLVFARDASTSAFDAAIGRLMDHFGQGIDADGAIGMSFERDLVAGLIHGLSNAGLAAEAFPVVRSVQRAVAHVRSNPQQDCSDQELARIAGITVASLQRNFRECLGIPASQFVRDVRLDWAHERLSGTRECRSINRLATEIGFTSAGVFARAYQRRFGESPSQTRIRAVRG